MQKNSRPSSNIRARIPTGTASSPFLPPLARPPPPTPDPPLSATAPDAPTFPRRARRSPFRNHAKVPSPGHRPPLSGPSAPSTPPAAPPAPPGASRRQETARLRSVIPGNASPPVPRDYSLQREVSERKRPVSCYSSIVKSKRTTMSSGKVDVVLGSQWGDEGKGKLVDTVGNK